VRYFGTSATNSRGANAVRPNGLLGKETMTKITASRRQISEDWVSLHCMPNDSDAQESLFWAFETLDELMRSDPEEAWMIIDTVRQLNGTDIILANLAAGPLEDLLVNHGKTFIDRVEALARDDEQFRKVLSAVWKNDMPDALWARVKSVAGPCW